MNLFSQCGGNSCLWILILLLLAASCSGKCLDGILSGACTPVLIALLYTMWKNGTLSNIFCGNNCNCGCGC
ncbi:MAG: chorion class high-cysteine HCB protein 13 [Clostridiales bacterium]|nr:chorion class high-cysteine HCB protein 13 [Clostridiales bacterium]